MRIGAIIQARMSSQRLPGKVLREVNQKPMLGYLLERLQHSTSLDEIVVATSSDDSDNPVADFCRECGVACHRGSLSDVVSRFKEILDVRRFDGFVRVNGDSPLLDQRLVDRAVDIFTEGEFEIVTNVLPRTYPPGQSVEVLRGETFQAACGLMREAEDLEHVTRFFYRNRENYRIFNFASDQNFGSVHLSVDTPRDMNVFTAIVSSMDRPHWQYDLPEVVRLYQEAGRVRGRV